jgi:1-deoxy-D-xylulose-5-phosphate reductoisomerase
VLKRKKVVVLGCTGSIGKQTLEVVKALEPGFEVTALACSSSVRSLARQVREFCPRMVAVTGDLEPSSEAVLSELEEVRVYRGRQGLIRMLEEIDADLVVNGIAGAEGLLPSVKTLEKGTNLALANKETIVMAGPVVSELARRSGSLVLPVDSEHHALFSLLQGRRREELREIILTASGGAFRDLSYRQLRDVGVQDAVVHPNWSMGAKITVDSATMANKGLEVIEAHHLFGIAVSAIKVLIHPQSYVHSLIRTKDGFLYAQLSQPDMHLPIQNALTYPEILPSCLEPFDLTGRRLSFEAVDPEKYRLLFLAYQAAEQARGYPVAYNAANEVAVHRFLAGEICFLDISCLVEEALQADWSAPADSVQEVLQVDRQAREKATRVLNSKRERDCLKWY